MTHEDHKLALIISILLVLTFLAMGAYADDSDEVLGGSLTQHLFNQNGMDSNYANRVSGDGSLIRNPMLGFRQVQTQGLAYQSEVYFGGQNSIGGPMFGAAYSFGLNQDGYRAGLVFGAYMQDTRPMLDRDIVPAMIIPYRGWCPSPIIGVELTKKFPIENNIYFIVNGMLTVPFINASVGVGWEY